MVSVGSSGLRTEETSVLFKICVVIGTGGVNWIGTYEKCKTTKYTAQIIRNAAAAKVRNTPNRLPFSPIVWDAGLK